MNINFANLIENLEVPLEIALFFVSEAFPYKNYTPKTLSLSEFRYLIYFIAEFDYDILVEIFDYYFDEIEIQKLQDKCEYLCCKFKGKRSDLRLIFE